MVAARQVDHPEVLDHESANHRVVDPEQSPALGARSPGGLDAASFPLRGLDGPIREASREPAIERPGRRRIVVADDQTRVTRMSLEEAFEAAHLSPPNQWRGKGSQGMGRLEVHVHEVEGTGETVPVRGVEHDSSRCTVVQRNLRVVTGPTQRDAHPVVVRRRLQATEGQLAGNGFGVLEAQLLGSEYIDTMASDQIDEALGRRLSPP